MADRYILIDPAIWAKPWFRRMDPESKTVFIWLFSNGLGGLTGIYQLDMDRLCFDTGVPPADAERALQTLEKQGDLVRQGEYIWLCGYTKHQRTTGDAWKKADAEAADLAGSTPLAGLWSRRYERHIPGGEEPDTPGLPHNQPTKPTNHTKPTNTTGPAMVMASPDEAEIIAVLDEVPGSPVSPVNALRNIRTLQAEWPDLDILAVAKDMRAWHRGDGPKPKHVCGNKSLSLRNFCHKAHEKDNRKLTASLGVAGDGRLPQSWSNG